MPVRSSKYKSSFIAAVLWSVCSIASGQNIIWIGIDPDNTNWSNPDNWQDEVIPDSNAYSAFFRSDQGTERTVIVDDDYTIKRIAIQLWSKTGPSAFTIDGAGRILTVDRNEGNSLAGVFAQGDVTHTINSDIVISNSNANPTAYTRIASDAPSTLIINGSFTAETKTEISSTGITELTGNIINNSELAFSQEDGNTTISGNGIASGTGLLTFNSGVINLNRTSALSGSGISLVASTVNFNASNAIPPILKLTVSGNSTLNFNDAEQAFGPLHLAITGKTLTLSLNGSSRLTFTDSKTQKWEGSLDITLAGASSIQFGTNASSLTAAQLEKITINGARASLDSAGYLVARP